MKKAILLIGLALALIMSNTAYAFDSGSTGALGAFNPQTTTQVTLPHDGKLNYTTVNIPQNVTVTFKNLSSYNSPVYMLATGDVTIAGTINVNGDNATSTITGKGGPGGFNGGYGGGTTVSGGKGLGPGGGNPGINANGNIGGGGGGGFGHAGSNGSGTNGGTGGSTYGNVKLLPLIGGSGGGGGTKGSIFGTWYPGGSGGGGGGAIVIASSTTITLTGTITANGGSGYGPVNGAGGSGGAIKLVANTISGNGVLNALGGAGNNSGGSGGYGRIRIEATTNNIASTDPPLSFGEPGNIFASNMPSLTITSIAGASTPSSPTGTYNQPDLLLPSSTTSPVVVTVSASNIPDGTTVKVWSIPQYESAVSRTATLTSSTATVNDVPLSTNYSNIITAEATFTITAMNYDGEEINRIRVATTMGGKSEVFYITSSGKEIKGELVAGLIK